MRKNASSRPAATETRLPRVDHALGRDNDTALVKRCMLTKSYVLWQTSLQTEKRNQGWASFLLILFSTRNTCCFQGWGPIMKHPALRAAMFPAGLQDSASFTGDQWSRLCLSCWSGCCAFCFPELRSRVLESQHPPWWGHHRDNVSRTQGRGHPDEPRTQVRGRRPYWATSLARHLSWNLSLRSKDQVPHLPSTR